jgi:nucleotide-binding universal stress UspA family protein
MVYLLTRAQKLMARAMRGDETMFEHIVLPLDGSKLAESVLPHAVTLSKAFNSKLTLLRVVYQEEKANQHRMINPIEWQMRKSEADAYLQSVQKRLKGVDLESEIHVIEGRPAEQIIEFAKREHVELLILSSHGKSGPSAWNINSTVQKVLLRAFMPVMIIRAYQEEPSDLDGVSYKRLFLPMDGSKRSECILPLAESICKLQNSQVFLTHIVEEPKLPRQTPITEEVKTLIEKLLEINIEEAENYFSKILRQFPKGNVEIIIESSKDPTVTLHTLIDRKQIDLVLLSAHGYSGENQWPYGKIALNFIAYGTTPLIIIQDLKENEIEKTLAELYAEQSKGH